MKTDIIIPHSSAWGGFTSPQNSRLKTAVAGSPWPKEAATARHRGGNASSRSPGPGLRARTLTRTWVALGPLPRPWAPFFLSNMEQIKTPASLTPQNFHKEQTDTTWKTLWKQGPVTLSNMITQHALQTQTREDALGLTGLCPRLNPEPVTKVCMEWNHDYNHPFSEQPGITETSTHILSYFFP